jgi:hypothetical protein
MRLRLCCVTLRTSLSSSLGLCFPVCHRLNDFTGIIYWVPALDHQGPSLGHPVPPGDLGPYLGTCGHHNWGAPGMEWVGARDAAQHPVPRTPPQRTNWPSVHRAEGECQSDRSSHSPALSYRWAL